MNTTRVQVRVHIPGGTSLRAFETTYSGTWEGWRRYIFLVGVEDPTTGVVYGPGFIVSVDELPDE